MVLKVHDIQPAIFGAPGDSLEMHPQASPQTSLIRGNEGAALLLVLASCPGNSDARGKCENQ